MSDTHTHWNKTSARAYIESKQDPDGAFTDPGLTADVLMALTHKGLGAIRNFDCGRGDTDYESHDGKKFGYGEHAHCIRRIRCCGSRHHPPLFYFIFWRFIFFSQPISMLSV